MKKLHTNHKKMSDKKTPTDNMRHYKIKELVECVFPPGNNSFSDSITRDQADAVLKIVKKYPSRSDYGRYKYGDNYFKNET